jgi:tetrapyrrole methylase family protein/MazG family protein
LVQSGVQLANGRVVAHLVDEEPYAGGRLALSPLRPMLFTHVYDAGVCQAIHRLLSPLLPEDHAVTVVEYAGSAHEVIRELPLSALDEEQGGPLVTLWIPASDEFGAAASDPRAMQRITARLRRPDGCPWDRKQTHQSLARNFVDEVYEVVDAIESGDPAAMAEELGDLFLLIMMEAQIGHEAATFSIEDIYAGIARKIVGRHPHVFGEAVVETDADLSGVWAAAKVQEQAEGRKHGSKDIDGEPYSMPALTRATRVLARNPVVPTADTPELLRIVGELVARGEDPDTMLKEQLREHVSRQSTTS